MNQLLNGDFSAWNHGTSFVNPSVNTQIADDWFIGAGQGSQTTYTRDGSGPFSVGIVRTGVTNSAGEFYQDVPATLLAGTSAVATVGVAYPGGSVPTVSITMSDGFNSYTFSDSLGVFSVLSITGFISPFATTVRVTVHSGSSVGVVEFSNATLDSTAHNVNVSDSISLGEFSPTSPHKHVAETQTLTDASHRIPTKFVSDVQILSENVLILRSLGPADTLTLGEWVTVYKIPANPWSNF